MRYGVSGGRWHECKVCQEQFRRKGQSIPFSGGDVQGWRITFRWPPDLCELDAIANGMEDLAEVVLSIERGRRE